MEDVTFGGRDPHQARWNSSLSWLLGRGEEPALGGEDPGAAPSPPSTTTPVSLEY